MFKHLLIPTDGSPLSERAALKGLELARTLGARVTALHVSPRFHVITYRTEMLEDSRDDTSATAGCTPNAISISSPRRSASRCRV